MSGGEGVEEKSRLGNCTIYRPVDKLIQLKIIIIFSKRIVQGVSNPEDQNGHIMDFQGKPIFCNKNCSEHKLQIFFLEYSNIGLKEKKLTDLSQPM